MKRNNNSGQALLIILLIMAVGLTIGLSVISRSVTDIRLSQQEEESARAFSAAEAGLEAYLAGSPITLFEGFTITSATRDLGEGNIFIFPQNVSAGDIKTVWLVNHVDEETFGSDFYEGSNITFYWGNENLEDVDEEYWPALEAVVIYKEGTEFTTKRVAFDPNAGRASENNFTPVIRGSHDLEGEKFSFKRTFNQDIHVGAFPTGKELYALRLKLIFNSEKQALAVEGNASFPRQGTCLQATAKSDETGISRKVEQCQFYKSLPSIFDYVLFSEGDLKKELE